MDIPRCSNRFQLEAQRLGWNGERLLRVGILHGMRRSSPQRLGQASLRPCTSCSNLHLGLRFPQFRQVIPVVVISLLVEVKTSLENLGPGHNL